MRKCARIHGPTLWKFPPAVKAWRNSTTTTYFGPACPADGCDINKLLQSKQTEEARQRSKQIQDGLEAAGGGGRPAYLRTQFKFMVTPGPLLGFGLGFLRLLNVTGSLEAEAETGNPSSPQGQGEIVLWHEAINCPAESMSSGLFCGRPAAFTLFTPRTLPARGDKHASSPLTLPAFVCHN